MSSSAKKILIVEDEASLSGALRDKLSSVGYEILQEYDGEKAVTTALREHPDLILLDILMPHMDGLAVAKQLRADAWGKDVPIIVLSNFDAVNKVQEAMEMGIFEYVLKSDTKIENIVARVYELLESERDE